MTPLHIYKAWFEAHSMNLTFIVVGNNHVLKFNMCGEIITSSKECNMPDTSPPPNTVIFRNDSNLPVSGQTFKIFGNYRITIVRIGKDSLLGVHPAGIVACGSERGHSPH